MDSNKNANFDIAEDLFNKNQYELAFDMFKAIAENELNDACTRAEAYNMLGVIISGPCPYLVERESGIDESGVQYFEAAMMLDPKNIGAAHNIIEAFYEGPTGHQNLNLVKQACVNLKRWNFSSLTPKEQVRINEILQFRYS